MRGNDIETSDSQVKSSRKLFNFLTALTMLNFIALAGLSVFIYSTYTDIKSNSAEISQTNRRIDTLNSDLSELSSIIEESMENSEDKENEIQPDDTESPYPESGFGHPEDNSSDYGEWLDRKNKLVKKKTPELRFPRRKPDFYDLKEKDKENVLHALYWLRDHQKIEILNGYWSCDNFIEKCKTNASNETGEGIFKRVGVCANINGKSDKGWGTLTNSVTALATLAFLGAGYTFESGEFKLTVKRAMRYFMNIQSDDGLFGSKTDKYCMLSHALCTQAMAEAYAMTAVARLRGPVHMAVDYIAQTQNGDDKNGWLGWGLDKISEQTDTFVTALTVIALKTARYAGATIPNSCWDGANRVLKKLTLIPENKDNENTEFPRTGYLEKGDSTFKLKTTKAFDVMPTMDALNIFCRQIMRTKSTDSDLMWQANFIANTDYSNLPSTKKPEKIDFLYWHFASLAMFQMGDNYWNLWKKPVFDSIISLQRLEDKDSCAYGSWDPIDAWGSAGGRVYATAINALTLETPYRYN